ncbi:MAG: pilus assembly PilX family protein [Nevskiales bacterium]
MNSLRFGPYRQQGAVSLVVAIILVIALAMIALASTRNALVEHRMSGNTAHAQSAFAVGEAGTHNALAYLVANQSVAAADTGQGWLKPSSNPRWLDCAAGVTAPPCGNGSQNLHGVGWKYFGPVPNLITLPGDYGFSSWYVSDSIGKPAVNTPFLGCLNLGLTALLPGVTGALIGTVNTLLNLIAPGLGLPVNLCLPINFQNAPLPPPPNRDNPSVHVVTEASTAADPQGGNARVQLATQTASVFAHLPVAALMVDGTANLAGDIRIWGNPRPPTVPPNDFSVLTLNDILGLNVTNLLGLHMAGGQAASLAPLLNLTVTEVLALDLNVTFPLSIWSRSTTTLTSSAVGINILKGARTCAPQFGGAANSPCLPLSQSISIPASSILLLVPPLSINLPLKLPDVQDPTNLVSTIGSLLDTDSPPAFPADLFNYTFGLPSSKANELKARAQQVNNCDSLNNDSVGLFWVNGNCQLNGNIGTLDRPAVIIAEGNLNIVPNTDFYGVVYLRGNGVKSIIGPSNTNRPILRGAVLSEGPVAATGNINLVHDYDVIRRAGYKAGRFVPMAGGWFDEWSGS